MAMEIFNIKVDTNFCYAPETPISYRLTGNLLQTESFFKIGISFAAHFQSLKLLLRH